MASRGPGLKKARAQPLLDRRQVELWKSSDYRLRELFEAADVMSEGATRAEAEGAVYYGSTSVLLPRVSRGGAIPDEGIETLLGLLRVDPHARLRAVRIACLEAQLRAVEPLGMVRAELTFRLDSRGIRIDVDVEAKLATADRQARQVRAGAAPKRSGRD